MSKDRLDRDHRKKWVIMSNIKNICKQILVERHVEAVLLLTGSCASCASKLSSLT